MAVGARLVARRRGVLEHDVGADHLVQVEEEAGPLVSGAKAGAKVRGSEARRPKAEHIQGGGDLRKRHAGHGPQAVDRVDGVYQLAHELQGGYCGILVPPPLTTTTTHTVPARVVEVACLGALSGREPRLFV